LPGGASRLGGGCNIPAQGLTGLIGYSYQQAATFFSGSPSRKNSKVKHAWPETMGDRPGSSSRVRTSEDKVCRKDLCWSVRAVYVLEKRPDVSRPGLEEAGRYRMVSELTLAVSRARVSQLRRHGAYVWCGPRVVTQHATCAGTRHTDVPKRGRSWLGIGRRGRRSLKGVSM
jgi:hypothetical protein